MVLRFLSITPKQSLNPGFKQKVSKRSVHYMVNWKTKWTIITQSLRFPMAMLTFDQIFQLKPANNALTWNFITVEMYR